MAKPRFHCLKCGVRAVTAHDLGCQVSRGGVHEWAPLLPPTDLQARADVVALGVRCRECHEPAGQPCRARVRRKLLVRTHIWRRLAVRAELGL